MSATETEHLLHLNDALLSHLQCPVCLFVCKSPIYSCRNGHALCGACRHERTFCPRCLVRGRFNVRNRFAEHVATLVWVPCKFQAQGCPHKGSLADLDLHHLICDYRYECKVVRDCPFVGQRHALLEHVANKHPGNIGVWDRMYVWDYSHVRSNVGYVTLFESNNELFWFYRRYIADEEAFCFYWRYVGRKEEAPKFRTELMVCSVDEISAMMKKVGEPLGLDELVCSRARTVVLNERNFTINGKKEIAYSMRLRGNGMASFYGAFAGLAKQAALASAFQLLLSLYNLYL